MHGVSAVIDDLGKRFAIMPLFLVGTSRGSVSVAALGAKLGQRIAGVVLTATMFRAASRKSNEPGPGLSGFDFSSIKVPALIVHHVSDQCEVTPYSDAARLSDKYPLVTVFGGSSPQAPVPAMRLANTDLSQGIETVEQSLTGW